MGKLSVFNFITLNGYFKGKNEDINWAHESPENEFAAESVSGQGILLFGRVTYDMMASYWQTPDASKNAPAVAKGMNDAEKIVFSRSLTKPEWRNTRVIKNDIEQEVKKLKQSDKHMTLLGSGSILSQLAQQGLIDEYQIMVHPVALAEGTPLLAGINHKLKLNLATTKAFKSGTVLLCYQPA